MVCDCGSATNLNPKWYFDQIIDIKFKSDDVLLNLSFMVIKKQTLGGYTLCVYPFCLHCRLEIISF